MSWVIENLSDKECCTLLLEKLLIVVGRRRHSVSDQPRHVALIFFYKNIFFIPINPHVNITSEPHMSRAVASIGSEL